MDSNNLSEFNEKHSLEYDLEIVLSRYRQGLPSTWLSNDSLLVLSNDQPDLGYLEYINKTFSGIVSPPIKPHILELAALCLSHLINDKQDQSILLLYLNNSRGEQGSFKTTYRKQITNFLVASSVNNGKRGKVLSGSVKLETILEAFGHYSCAYSKNASGFGRFCEYQYDGARLVGLKVLEYGLDSKRVWFHKEGERTFNVFYQLVAGTLNDEKLDYKIIDPNGFTYLSGSRGFGQRTIRRFSSKNTLSRSNSIKVFNSTDTRQFQLLKEHMKSCGFGHKTQASIFKTISGILHLGNIDFVDSNGKTVVKYKDSLKWH